jgi:hypothetical protein
MPDRRNGSGQLTRWPDPHGPQRLRQ